MKAAHEHVLPRAGKDLVEHARKLINADDGEWYLRPGELFCTVIPGNAARPGEYQTPEQGWKLHISATPVSARPILDRVMPVLFRHRVAFKFAGTTESVQWLGGRECDRAAAGKFITVYPADDAQFTALAAELHDATAGLPGPRILSDRPYRPGGVVHYRYGGFGGRAELDNDGVLRYLLTAPDGSVLEDRREAWFTPPDWAQCPLPADPPATAKPAAVLLGGHYVVRQALRHSAKGGVYLAVDRNTESEAVIKHARAHAETNLRGADARDRLRHEADMLELLARHVPAPRALEIFEQDGDVFLAETRLPGQALRFWVGAATGSGAGMPASQAMDMARRLIELVGAVHDAGVVLRDLSPMNVLVAPDGTPQLVDLEMADRVGAVGARTGTPGYRPPELQGAPRHAAAAVAEDLFSLGALLFLLATGNDPLLPDDADPARPAGDRLASWLQQVGDDAPATAPLRPLILRLTADVPEQRGSLAEARAMLAALPQSSAGPGAPAPTAAAEPVPTPERLLADGLAHLVRTMTPTADRLWPAGAFGAQTDPGNVQHGAAGVLGTMLRALSIMDAAGVEATRTAATWLAKRDTPPGPVLPGLYFGRAGVAWALAEAGDVLKDGALLQQGIALAQELPRQWGNPDVTHGLAGAGMAQLRIWQLTGDAALLASAAGYADEIVAAARTGEHGPLWTVPVSFPSRLAGSCHYGFAHGTAGIGYFLLAAGQATGQPRYLDLATKAGAALCAIGQTDEHGATWWATGPADPSQLPHWCNGSSGVGTFLLRLFGATSDERFATATRGAARAVHMARWQSLPSACHGLAGNGQFLLDAAESLNEPMYHLWAEDLATALAIRTARVGDRLLVADESGRSVTAEYNVGLAGVLDFLGRLLHGGSRPWMLDAPAAEGSGRC